MLRPHLWVDVPVTAVVIATAIGVNLTATAPLAALALGLHTWGTVNPRSSWYLPVSWRVAQAGNSLALSFDDGPDPVTTPRILDVLAARGWRATFFCIGHNAAAQPALVRRILAEGHSLGLHSHSHGRSFNCWGLKRLGADLDANAATLADITGTPAPRLWRPPMGLKNPLVAETIRRRGLHTVTWSRRGFDTGSRRAPQVAQRLAAGIAPGAILVLHDGAEPCHPRDTSPSAEALEQLCPQIEAAGLRSEALSLGPAGLGFGPTAGDATPPPHSAQTGQERPTC
ncbi:MAG: polysaccharide deacetylase family protein [Planctomycetota bacterium]|jgi:peptidoglycan/xylan/chitin deacetylase (PgdA/CDA1 family)|nr:polysaccharide deacetylase family protein [Planctomycetota bacterium]